MKKKQLCLLIAAAVLAAGLSGCVSAENRDTGDTTTTTAASSATPATYHKPVTVSITTTTATQTPRIETTTEETTETEPPEEEIFEEYNSFTFTDEDNDTLSRCVFVGDSICSGLKVYDIIPAKRVVAQGNIAARNIFDFTFIVNGEEQSLLSALAALEPEYVVFSMGMNDVNMTSQDKFAQNYTELLDMTESFLPDAKLIVLSVTPIDRKSTFTTNENIDSFNERLSQEFTEKENRLFVDVTPELKNSVNALKTLYSSGDGIHLAPDAYYAVLSQLCNAVHEWEKAKEEQPEETEDKQPSETAEEQVTEAIKEQTAEATKEQTAEATKEQTADTTKEQTADTTKEPPTDTTKEQTAEATKEQTAVTTNEQTADTTKEQTADTTKKPPAENEDEQGAD